MADVVFSHDGAYCNGLCFKKHRTKIPRIYTVVLLVTAADCRLPPGRPGVLPPEIICRKINYVENITVHSAR